MRKSLRYLRIAFSAVCGIACVLLIALWVRSYSYDSMFKSIPCGTLGDKKYAIWIFPAQIGVAVTDFGPAPRDGSYPAHLLFMQPFWRLVAVAGLLSAMPSVRWSKRFSLRTLLIATTLVAVALGIIASK